MNKKLLLELFRIPSKSGEETKVQEFICNYLTTININFDVDAYGNIYNINKKDKPIIGAHMDTVQETADCHMARYIDLKKNGTIKGYGVIGGDDKCGIYTILDLLTNGHTDINFAFFVEEETGGVGSRAFVKDNDITHIQCGIVLDRKGNSDILCVQNNYGTKEYQNYLKEIGKQFNYSPACGTFSDADQLSEQISACNLSCGYYNAHSKHEFVVLTDLQNCINFTHSIIKNLSDIKFKAPEKNWNRKYYGKYSKFYYNDYYDDYDDDYDYLYGNKKHNIDLHNNVEKDYKEINCSICGCKFFQKDINKITTIGMNLCNYCYNDLYDELIRFEHAKVEEQINIEKEVEAL